MKNKIFNMPGKVIPFVFLLFIMLSYTAVHGQGTDNKLLPVITLPSPEAASLGKYGVWPVSQYTGVPNISVPVYNININGFSLPITLNYHSGGVKIDDKASWVGTNWSLSAGGMIGRTVVGTADEGLNGMADLKFGAGIKSTYFLTGSIDYNFFLGVNKNLIDAEADVYYYNFAGLSGKLLVDSNFNVRTVPASNIKFLQTPFTYRQPGAPAQTPPYVSWIIADASGNIFKFGVGEEGIERTSIKQAAGNVVSQGITALYLVQIILANKADTINFEYDEKSEYYSLPYTQSCKAITLVRSGLQGSPAGEIPPQDGSTPCGSYNNAVNANEVLYNGATLQNRKRSFNSVTGHSKLRKISWRGGQVEFKAATIREDMVSTTGRMLDSIIVSNKMGEKIKATRLEYAYVNGRYYLDSLRETGSTAADPLRYGFEYFNRSTLPPSEPMAAGSQLNPYAQDHWGYYNAALGNTNLLPPDAKMPSSANFVLTSNRKPDTAAAAYGTLHKITYPTGGYTNFRYEGNIYDTATSINPSVPVIPATAAAAMDIVHPVGKTTTFYVPFDQTDISIFMHFNDYAHPPNKRDAVFQYVKVDKEVSPGNYTNVYYWDAYNNFPSGGVVPNPRGFYDFNLNAVLSLTGGTYRLVVNDSCPMSLGGPLANCLDSYYPDPDPADDIWIIPLANASITYSTYDVSTEAHIAGGLRIKEIASFAGTNILATRKRYEYSPGNLLLYPGYMHTYEKVANITGAGNCSYHVRMNEITGTSQTILGFTQGATIGYSNVRELDLDASDNNQGYTSYRFSYTTDSLNAIHHDNGYWQGNATLDVSFPTNSFDYKRGLLLSKTIYKKNGANYVKIDSLDNKYDFNDYNTAKHYYRQRNLRIRQIAFGDWGTPFEESGAAPSGGTAWEFSYVRYDIITSWVQQLSSEQITYDQNGANPLNNLTKYYYDNPAHMQATRVETTNSKGEKLISHTSYPQDYASGTTFIDNMVAENIIATPIENVSYLVDASQNVNILKGVVSVYKAGGKGIVDRIKVLETAGPVALSGFRFSNTSQGLLPFNTTARNALTTDSRYVDRVIVPVVNAYGNTNEQLKANDAKEVYFWGYKGLYPVAKLVGADYSTAQTYITQSILDNATGSGDDAALRTELNKLRNVPGAQVTTFTYKPLVGITSQTDPSGKVVFYEYDAFGRLKLIKDLNGKILKQFDYQYKVPVTQ